MGNESYENTAHLHPMYGDALLGSAFRIIFLSLTMRTFDRGTTGAACDAVGDTHRRDDVEGALHDVLGMSCSGDSADNSSDMGRLASDASHMREHVCPTTLRHSGATCCDCLG